jgi:hypothetical protein
MWYKKMGGGNPIERAFYGTMRYAFENDAYFSVELSFT